MVCWEKIAWLQVNVVSSGSVNIFKCKLKTLLILNIHLCVEFLFIFPIILQVKPVIFIII